MNKGLEVIEAMRLYRVPLEQVDVVIHRQSIVHSFVEYKDGAVLVLESECTAQRLMDELTGLLSDKERHARMGSAVQRMAVPDSAERICDILETLAAKE